MHYNLSCPKSTQSGNENVGKENGLSASQSLCVSLYGSLLYVHMQG